ncbi:MAG TPA: dienelactone hydrolase family protein [Anaerolineales bacterium]|jgi:carboxymethylenebutenolidase|nr:dienelactone hydrolase family protein [Anaerolineales bacterium]
MNGQEVTFDVNGKSANGYLALPSRPDSPGIIVLHAWWGLNQFFKNLCERLAAEGFVVFAPDLNEGRVATTIDEAKEIMSSLDGQRKYDVAMAAVDFLRGRSEVREEAFSLIGFSMGAAWSLALASERPEDFQKVVLFYGAGEGDFAKIKAEVLGHFSDADEWEDIDYVRSMEKDLRNAGVKTNFHIYPQLPHWFFEDDRPEYNPQAAELAWSRTLEFLR